VSHRVAITIDLSLARVRMDIVLVDD
jgi:hypothetical protein